MKNHRVVITGVGITSTLGHTFEEVTKSLRSGYSQIIKSEKRKEMGFRSTLVPSMSPCDPKYKISRRHRKYMPEAAMYGVVSWLKTLDECQLKAEDFMGEDVGVIIGNDSSSDPLEYLVDTLREYKETHFLGSSMVIKTMNSTCSMNLGPIVKAQGMNLTLSGACASGAHAVGYGYYLLRSGLQEAIIAGGVQETNALAMASFDALGAFSCNDDPSKAARPFDHKRDGLVPGGGGAILVLETLERARKLNHKIYGEILSYSFSSDGSHLTIPSGAGAERCMRKAITAAGISSLDIDYINAHATSTPIGDKTEAQAIHNIFGENGPLVSSTKSMTGHECWMSGASELIYSLAMMHGGFIAPNINFERQEEDAKKINITSKTVEQKPNIILSNSFGFGGTNACIILKDFRG